MEHDDGIYAIIKGIAGTTRSTGTKLGLGLPFGLIIGGSCILFTSVSFGLIHDIPELSWLSLIGILFLACGIWILISKKNENR